MAAAMDEQTKSWQDAVKFVNCHLGSEKENLDKLHALWEEVQESKKSIESQLSLVSSEVPSKIEQAVKDAQDATSRVTQFSKEHKELCNSISDWLVDTETPSKHLASLTKQIEELENYAHYLTWISKIEELSSEIQSALLIGSVEKAVGSFTDLVNIVKDLLGSQCIYLVKFAKDTLNFWYDILKKQLSSEYEEVLKVLQWPFIVSTVKPLPQQNLEEANAKMETLFDQLLHLQLPDDLQQETLPSSTFLQTLPGWRPLALPLQLMVKPLAKRFRYHFFGTKQTNSLEKPEWYLTQTLTWISDHQDFLRKRIQPLLDKAGIGYMDSVMEFVRGLVMLVMEKMQRDIPELVYDDNLFAHFVDETLAFEREMREGYGYPSSNPGCLHVLCQEVAFKKWLAIEKKFALERMDAMLTSANAWDSQYKEISDIDDLKVPECGESFMTLMLTVSERYKPLPEISCRVRFLDLQLELYEDLRIRLQQVRKEVQGNPLAQQHSSILNTVHYIKEILQEWGELPFFQQLHYFKCLEQTADPAGEEEPTASNSVIQQSVSMISTASMNSEELDPSLLDSLEGSVFDDMIKLYAHIEQDMTKAIVSYVVSDVKARSRPYIADRWVAMPSHKEMSFALSNSACEMFLVLKDHLYHLHQQLSTPIFTSFWQKTAADMNNFMYSEVVLSNRFSDGGASQLNFDITRNLFPLFGEFTTRPENYFKDLKEACVILTMNIGQALLLKDVLYRALHDPTSDPNAIVTDPVATLQELKIYKLLPEEVELVLSRRTNVSNP